MIGRALLAWTATSLAGCTFGIPDYYPPVKPPKPCEVVVYDHEGHGACLTREEFERWVRRNVDSGYGDPGP